MKIRNKFTIGLVFILIISLLVMNMTTTNILKGNMENGINTSLKQVMNSTHEYIRYKLLANGYKNRRESLVEEGNYIIKYISLNYQCKCKIVDINSKFIDGSAGDEFRSITESSIKIAKQGKAVVDLKYEDNGIMAILTYPIYIDNDYIGIISILKEYNSEYRNYKSIINITNIIEVGIFICIFIFLFWRITKITNPISSLTEAIKKLGNGQYDTLIDGHGNDEVAILAREFINMRDKIKEQIETIESEKEKVYKLEKGRREFFNSVTHELKTPLTAISGYAELLISGMVKDEEFYKRAIERIYSESDRLHKLVLQLIEVSKGMYIVKEEFISVDIKKLITQICNDMSIKANKYSLEILKNISEGMVLAQEDKIRQVVINIVDNAIKYSSGGKNIYVTSYIKDDIYYIEVINNSEPIPSEIFDKIFDPFVKSDDDKNKDSRGFGLYLCKEIIKEHEGEIFMENGSIIKTKISLKIIV